MGSDLREDLGNTGVALEVVAGQIKIDARDERIILTTRCSMCGTDIQKWLALVVRRV